MDGKCKRGETGKLNEFLRSELSAIETYEQCIRKLDDDSLIGTLRLLRASHKRRAELLRSRVLRLGGTPETGSGLWDAMVELADEGVNLLGKSAVLAVIEKGERDGDRLYRDLSGLSPSSTAFVQVYLVPEQEHTCASLDTLWYPFS